LQAQLSGDQGAALSALFVLFAEDYDNQVAGFAAQRFSQLLHGAHD